MVKIRQDSKRMSGHPEQRRLCQVIFLKVYCTLLKKYTVKKVHRTSSEKEYPVKKSTPLLLRAFSKHFGDFNASRYEKKR
jgi:hypothetical protein